MFPPMLEAKEMPHQTRAVARGASLCRRPWTLVLAQGVNIFTPLAPPPHLSLPASGTGPGGGFAVSALVCLPLLLMIMLWER